MPGSFETYRALGHRTVHGWVDPQTLDVLRFLSDAQESAGVEGAVAEIGVHHGKLFIGLQLLNRPGVAAVAIDVFDDQHLNVDQSGQGDLHRFESHVRRWGDWSSVVVKQGDSTQLTGSEVRELAHGPVRMFSVDGGHTEETVHVDMRTAEQSIGPGGIVVVDDVFNEEWPGVSVGTLRYLDGGGTLVPFAIAYNKTYFTDNDHAALFREAIRRVYGRRWRTAHKTTVFHQRDVEVLWPTPLTPRSILRRNRLARKAHAALTTVRGRRGVS
ncbi:MAG: class I SAM-dependent methyltransferase [Aeromicrobium sp.]